MSQQVTVSNVSALAEKKTAKFFYDEDGNRKEGFVIRLGDALYAYRNECRHIPVTLDWVENRFISSDDCYLQCATHGALFEISTGLCVDGPPAGLSLHALKLELRGDDAVVSIPDRPTGK